MSTNSKDTDLRTPDGRLLCALVPSEDAVLGFSRTDLLYAWPTPDSPDDVVTLTFIDPQRGVPHYRVVVQGTTPSEFVMVIAGFGVN